MAHFAEIDSNNIVIRVLVVNDADAVDGQNFLANTLNLGGIWKQTSYNTSRGIHVNGGTPYRFNYAGIGFTYDAARDAFIAPKPFNSWVLDEATCCWQAPTPKPTDNKRYYWSEDDLSWREINNS